MGAPVETTRETTGFDNPMGTDGMVSVEFSTLDPEPIVDLFGRLGFRQVASHATARATLWQQGDVRFVINSQPGTHGAAFAELHGSCISALAFRVADAGQALDRALRHGATAYAGEGATLIDAPALEGIGGSLLYLIDAEAERRFGQLAFPGAASAAPIEGVGVTGIDHLTHNVVVGNVDRWADFYRDVFGFREIWYYHAKGKATGFRTKAMKSPCGRICIPVNEATEPESQIQEWIDEYKGEGVQHLALLSSDLPATIEVIGGREIPFMPIPESYYKAIDDRLPGHGEDVARLQRTGILLDGTRADDASWQLLLQIFSKNLIGPIFFEFIQRKGNEGFGEGNAQALFEAIERDQIERGVVAE